MPVNAIPKFGGVAIIPAPREGAAAEVRIFQDAVTEIPDSEVTLPGILGPTQVYVDPSLGGDGAIKQSPYAGLMSQNLTGIIAMKLSRLFAWLRLIAGDGGLEKARQKELFKDGEDALGSDEIFLNPGVECRLSIWA